MNDNLSLLPYIQISLIILLVGIIYIVWAKIPSGQKQREEGEKVIAKRLTRSYSEVKKEFQDYFRKHFMLLVLVSLGFLIVDLLIAVSVSIFLESQGLKFIFFGDLPIPHMPRWAVAATIAFLMCSAGWLIIISLFYHNRAVKLSLETKYEDFFRER